MKLKNDGSYRFVSDFKKINKKSKKVLTIIRGYGIIILVRERARQKNNNNGA